MFTSHTAIGRTSEREQRLLGQHVGPSEGRPALPPTPEGGSFEDPNAEARNNGTERNLANRQQIDALRNAKDNDDIRLGTALFGRWVRSGISPEAAVAQLNVLASQPMRNPPRGMPRGQPCSRVEFYLDPDGGLKSRIKLPVAPPPGEPGAPGGPGAPGAGPNRPPADPNQVETFGPDGAPASGPGAGRNVLPPGSSPEMIRSVNELPAELQQPVIGLLNELGGTPVEMERNLASLRAALTKFGPENLVTVIKINPAILGNPAILNTMDPAATGLDAPKLAALKAKLAAMTAPELKLLKGLADAAIKVAAAPSGAPGSGTIEIKGGGNDSLQNKQTIVSMVRRWQKLEFKADRDMCEGTMAMMGVDLGLSDLPNGKVVMAPREQRLLTLIQGLVMFVGGLVDKIGGKKEPVNGGRPAPNPRVDAELAKPGMTPEKLLADKKALLKTKEDKLTEINRELTGPPPPVEARKTVLNREKAEVEKAIAELKTDIAYLESKRRTETGGSTPGGGGAEAVKRHPRTAESIKNVRKASDDAATELAHAKTTPSDKPKLIAAIEKNFRVNNEELAHLQEHENLGGLKPYGTEETAAARMDGLKVAMPDLRNQLREAKAGKCADELKKAEDLPTDTEEKKTPRLQAIVKACRAYLEHLQTQDSGNDAKITEVRGKLATASKELTVRGAGETKSLKLDDVEKAVKDTCKARERAVETKEKPGPLTAAFDAEIKAAETDMLYAMEADKPADVIKGKSDHLAAVRKLKNEKVGEAYFTESKLASDKVPAGTKEHYDAIINANELELSFLESSNHDYPYGPVSRQQALRDALPGYRANRTKVEITGTAVPIGTPPVGPGPGPGPGGGVETPAERAELNRQTDIVKGALTNMIDDPAYHPTMRSAIKAVKGAPGDLRGAFRLEIDMSLVKNALNEDNSFLTFDGKWEKTQAKMRTLFPMGGAGDLRAVGRGTTAELGTEAAKINGELRVLKATW